ncbi:lytic transglycosylase domain-containing protein [Jiella marina]|uniref:lytic transglycosylase domain-containing protein n=1 Tax=Jiella sp. LLJ827 TaxID=2917712 RepID=UPI002100FFC4|nr:transglycosylase SLT domain-containing protein [Jiella sp. LLJ827]
MVFVEEGSAALRRGASLALIIGLSALAGCLADGPGGAPLGIDVAGTAAPAQDAAPEPEISSGEIAEADRKVASREARQSAETGTISGSAAIDRMIERHALENEIPPSLAYAVVRVESRYNPKARGRGVYGLSQIKPATARSLGFSGSASDLLDADTNLTYGMKYLKGAWEKSGHDICGTALKYKGGHRATRMTASTKRYCSAVLAHMAEVKNRRRMPEATDSAPRQDESAEKATDTVRLAHANAVRSAEEAQIGEAASTPAGEAIAGKTAAADMADADTPAATAD